MNQPKKNKWLKALPIDISSLYEKVDEALPHSAKRWWWCWGGIIGILFGIQVVTGLLLAFYYRADPNSAYETLIHITHHARYGSFIRSLHHWSANFMIIFLFLHILRVFVTATFRDYRWGSWMFGVLLLGTTLGLAFTGYSLVSDQLSYWAIIVTSNILSEIPLLGGVFKQFFLAGDEYNSATLSRMYALHVQILPAAVMGLGMGHLFFIRLMGMYKPGNDADRIEETKITEKQGVYHFYPSHLTSEIAIGSYLFLVICLLAIAFPAVLGPQADPLFTPEHIKPEWYFYPFFHLLKLVPGAIGVMIMLALGVVMFFWPLLDHYLFRRIDVLFKGKLEIGMILGLTTMVFYLVWAVAEALN